MGGTFRRNVRGGVSVDASAETVSKVPARERLGDERMETKPADSIGKLFGQTLSPATEHPADCANADARTDRPKECLPRGARQRR
jgi:hypothetical protein